MIDERCLFLLNEINNACKGTLYKIFDKEELLLSFPDDLATDSMGLSECFRTLVRYEYISVKYEDEREICACTLSKGRYALEQKTDNISQEKRLCKKYFLSGFYGSLSGGMIVTIIAIILMIVFGGR